MTSSINKHLVKNALHTLNEFKPLIVIISFVKPNLSQKHIFQALLKTHIRTANVIAASANVECLILDRE